MPDFLSRAIQVQSPSPECCRYTSWADSFSFSKALSPSAIPLFGSSTSKKWSKTWQKTWKHNYNRENARKKAHHILWTRPSFSFQKDLRDQCMVLVSGKTALGNFSYLQDVVGQAIMQALQHPVSHLICAWLGRKNVKPTHLVEGRTRPV